MPCAVLRAVQDAVEDGGGRGGLTRGEREGVDAAGAEEVLGQLGDVGVRAKATLWISVQLLDIVKVTGSPAFTVLRADPHGAAIYGRPVERIRRLSGRKRWRYPACVREP